MKKPKSTDRKEIYEAIDGELSYQYSQFGENLHEIDAYATYIRKYSEALDVIATSPNPDPVKLDTIRKIAAICVKCMEQHGVVRRATSQGK